MLITYIYEVNEVWLVAVQQGGQALLRGDAHLAFGVWNQDWLVVLVEKHLPSCRPGEHRTWRHPLHLHHQGHMFFFILTGKQRVANVELVQNTAKRPHVYRSVVRDAQHDFRGSVEATLDVGVDLLVFEAARAEVYDLDS